MISSVSPSANIFCASLVPSASIFFRLAETFSDVNGGQCYDLETGSKNWQ